MLPVSFDDIRAARERIHPITHRTPALTSATFNRLSGLAAHFKCENLQRGGAFKIRGASNLVFSLSPEQLQRGIIAFSSGNHAQATALAGRHVGAKVTVVMPDDAPRVKREATAAAGAEIVTYDRLREDREAVTRAIVERTGAAIVPPFDHPLIIAGQGTATAELLEDAPALDAILVPVGGGGLASGTVLAAKAMNPRLRVYGVEPALANDAYLSLQAGRRISIPPPETIADGLRTPIIGELPFAILSHLLDGIVLVTEDEIRAAMQFFFSRMKLVVEPSGAVTAAAALAGKVPAAAHHIGLIVSGGNAEPAAFV